jgi:hypothetical protein
MKTKYTAWILSCILAWGCSSGNEDAPPPTLTGEEFFLAGYNSCSGVVDIDSEYRQAQGNFLISANLKDTLLTYKFPENLFKLPKETIAHGLTFTPVWFDDALRETLKFRIEYDTVPAEEKESFICTAEGPVMFKDDDFEQINITSGYKIDSYEK